MKQKSYDNKGILYLIPTPIGNLEDITIRSLNILKEVKFILCEDTRVSGKLLAKYEIKNHLVRCDEYYQEKVKEKVLEALAQGDNIGLVSDAGSPIISDPGYLISKYAIDNGYNVVALPGPTAFVPALSVSGINPSPFIFYGFLSNKISKKKKELSKLAIKEETIIIYESPHHLMSTLELMLDIFGDRKIAICREISKIYEEIIRGTINECIQELNNIKGEFVLIVDGNHNKTDYSELDVIEHINIYISDGYAIMDAIKKVAKERNVPKSVIYKEYIEKSK